MMKFVKKIFPKNLNASINVRFKSLNFHTGSHVWSTVTHLFDLKSVLLHGIDENDVHIF